MGGARRAAGVSVVIGALLALGAPPVPAQGTGGLRGRVTDVVTGAPIEGIQVTVLRVPDGSSATTVTGDDGSSATTVTGDDGAYELDGLAPGPYQAGFFDAREESWYLGTTPPDPVVVPSGGTPAVLDVVLEQGGVVSGMITSAHTGLRSYGQLSIGGQEVGLRWSERGFRTLPILAGTHRLRFWRPGYHDLVWPTDVVIAPGQEVAGIHASLRPAVAALSGCLWFWPFPFVDVPDGPHREAIACVAWRGIMVGRDAEHVDPAALLRRDQAAGAVARLVEGLRGGPLPAGPDTFVDDEGDVHEAAVDGLAALGVVRGTGDGRFDPGTPLTRGQAAGLLVRAWEAGGNPSLLPLGDVFGDDDGNVHEPAIDLLVAAGIVAGEPDGAYHPDDPIRRDQLATLLSRFLWRDEVP